jgi:hypothetical protein
MGDEGKYWSTVGSAGTLRAADLAKVSLDNAVITLGHGIAPPPATAAEDPSIVTPQVSAVVRYNVTPVDGLFVTGTFVYLLQLTRPPCDPDRCGSRPELAPSGRPLLHPRDLRA